MTACPVAISQEEFIHKVLADRNWRSFAVDSRQIKSGEVFFALPGERSDGHYYIPQAMDAGARAVVLYESWFRSHDSALLHDARSHEALLVPVRDSLDCLHNAAAAVFARSSAKKIGITGSSGKTSTKDLLVAVLSRVGTVHYSKGNYNSDIGLPIVLACISENADYAVLEMAMSEAGEMKTLADLVMPHYALLTNIGTAHIGNLGSVEAIAEEKFQIFSQMDMDNIAIIPEGDRAAQHYLEDHPLACQVLLYGLSEKYGFSLVTENESGSGSEDRHENGNGSGSGTTFMYGGEEYYLPLRGEHQLHNATGVITLARALGISAHDINAGFASFSLPSGRGNLLRGESILMDDSYNANPDSMKAAIEAARVLAEREQRPLCIILGDMMELGAMSQPAHAELIEEALGSDPRCILLFGEQFAEAAQHRASHASAYSSPHPSAHSSPHPSAHSSSYANNAPIYSFVHIEELGGWLRREAQSGDVFLIKASRGMELERIIPDLPGLEHGAERGAGTGLEPGVERGLEPGTGTGLERGLGGNNA